jgi:uncharacterized repeat protein (TIGR01451 family)
MLAAALAAVVAVALPTAPAARAAAGDTSGCGFAPTGSGTYADTICWIDLSGYDDAQARSAAGQPYTLHVGDYTVTFTARTTDVAGAERPPSITATGTPTWADGALGNSKYPNSYHGIPGKPAWLIHHEDFTPGADVGAQLTLDDITVTDPSGADVTSYAFIFGEAESSSQNEDTTWRSDRPITYLQTINPSGDRGCDQAVLTGLGTDSVTCPGRGPDGDGNWSSVLLRTTAPTTVSQAITTTSNNGSAFGIMVSRLRLNKTVDGRVRTTDSFDLSATTPEGGQLATASTGTDDSASTGPILVLPRNDGQGFTLSESATPGSGTDLAQYAQSWSCTRNGAPDPDLSATGVTSEVVSPAVGDYIDCTITNTAASFTVTKAASEPVAHPGDTVTYTVTVANTGPVAYTSADPASFTDDLSRVLDDASYDGDAQASAGPAPTYSAPVLSWSGPLAAQGHSGDSVTVVYSVTVHRPDKGNGELSNTADPPAGSGGSCADGSAPPCAPVVVPVQSYTVSKHTTYRAAPLGTRVTYTVTVANTGQVAYTSADPASFTDDLSTVLDDASYDGDAQASAGPAPEYTAPVLSWSGALGVGDSVTVTYSVTVDRPDAGDGHLTNAADPPSGNGGSCSDGSAPPCSPVDVPTQSYTVTKAASQSVTHPGDTVVYTVTVTNTGNAAYTAADPAGFTDDLTKVLDDATYDGDADHGATYAKPMLSWKGPLAVGQTVTVTYSVTVGAPDTGDGRLVNAADPSEPGGECAGGTAAPCPDVTVPVQSFTVVKTASESTAAPGDTVTYTITVTNTGAVAFTAAHPASFTDDLTKVLDDATYDGDADHGATYAEPTLSWKGALGVGQTVTVSYSVTVHDPDQGDGTLYNAVTTPTDPDGARIANCPAGASDPDCHVTSAIRAATAAPASTGNDTAAELLLALALLAAGGLAWLLGVRRRRS